MIRLALLLFLMCENVNAAPQDVQVLSPSPIVGNAAGPEGAAPFTIGHPLCQTGFWIKQRIDDRDRNGIIVKSRWIFGCANGRIVYGGKV